MGFFDEALGEGAVDVVAMLDGEAGKQVAECVAVGALVGLSLTRDGGALGVTVTVDGTPVRRYFRDAEQLELWLSTNMPEIAEAAGRASADGASAVPRRRTRRR